MAKQISKILTDRITTLKKLLAENDDFQQTFNFFYEEVLNTPGFFELSEQMEDQPTVTMPVQQSVKNLHEKIHAQDANQRTAAHKTASDFILINYIKELGMYHGPIKMYNAIGSYIFFENEKLGLINARFQDNPNVWFSRFMALPVEDGGIPLYNPPEENLN